jgi:hypothetical protein
MLPGAAPMMRFTPAKPHRPFHQPPGRENARGFTEYAMVRAIVAQVTERALLLTNESVTVPVWVPRSRLQSGSRAMTMGAIRGQEIAVQVELQFALDQRLV